MAYKPPLRKIFFVNTHCPLSFRGALATKNLENIHVDVSVYATEIFHFVQQHVFLPSVVWMTTIEKYNRGTL